MKYKILETEIREAAHHIAKALRAFGNDPIICDLSVLARETSEGNTDSYGFVVRYYPQGTGAVIEKQLRITYADDWAGCKRYCWKSMPSSESGSFPTDGSCCCISTIQYHGYRYKS